MIDIDIKYLVPLKGKYNRGVYECFCGNDMSLCLHENIVGYSQAKIGQVVIVQCNECFEYFYFHAMKTTYEIFVETLQENVHYGRDQAI